MLEGIRMTPVNRYACRIFIDNGLLFASWGREIFFLSMGDLARNTSEALQ